MNRRVRIGIICGTAVFLAALASFLLRSDEPVYKGKKLSSWLQGYDVWFNIPPNGNPADISHQTDVAVRAVGSNAIPTLIRMIRARDLTWKTKILHWWFSSHPSSQQPATRAMLSTMRAHSAFSALGSDGVAAVPDLIDIYTHDPSFQVRMAAAGCLGNIGPAASNAVPVLLAGATSQITNGILTMQAIYALRGIKAPPELFVPVLIKCLRDPYAGVQSTAVDTLGDLETNSLSAVPILLRMYQVSDYGAVRKPELKAVLERAIPRIDPKTAAELGIP